MNTKTLINIRNGQYSEQCHHYVKNCPDMQMWAMKFKFMKIRMEVYAFEAYISVRLFHFQRLQLEEVGEGRDWILFINVTY